MCLMFTHYHCALFTTHAIVHSMATEDLIKQALDLRSKGFTIDSIALAMGKSKSAVMLYLDPERMRKHKERAIAYGRKLWAENKQHAKALQLKSQRKNREKRNAYQRKYWANHAEQKREYARLYFQGRTKEDHRIKLMASIRSRFHTWAIWCSHGTQEKTRKGQIPMSELVGCTKQEWRVHFEKLLDDWKTGPYAGEKWQFDHIKPLCQFDFNDIEQIKQAMHWSNVRLLPGRLNAGRERREGLMPNR